MSEKNAGDSWEIGTDVIPQIIVIDLMFSKCFRGEYMWQLRKNLKGWWCGNSNVNYFDYFPVSCAGVGSVGMHQLKYNNLKYDLLEIFVPISPAVTCVFFIRLSTLRSPSPEKKKVIFLHCSKIDADLKKQYLVYGIFFWPETWRGSLYILLSPLIFQIPDFNYWTVLIFILIYFEWRDTENQQLYRDWLFFFTSVLVSFPFWMQKKMKIDHRFFIFVCSKKNENWTQIFIFLNFN